MLRIGFGREVCGSLHRAAEREWLVVDGLGGFAMGTVSGLRTRMYHGLLVAATRPPIGRMLGLAALDPVLVVGDRRLRFATHEWAGGAVDPQGFLDLETFALDRGAPRWRWSVGDLVLEREVAMVHGRPAVVLTHRLVRAPGPVRLELSALCTWRDVQGLRGANGSPAVEPAGDGFVFEGAYRVAGPGFVPGGEWYRGVRYRVEAERGLNDREDLWFPGTFVVELEPGDEVGVTAWAGDLSTPPPPAREVVDAARSRAEGIAARAEPDDDVDETLAVAADQFVVAGPTVVAGHPWFGDWSRDTMTSYEGLFLETNRWDEGRALLQRAAGTLSAGMLANTADVEGMPEFNTADGTLWFLHAVGRHVQLTGDIDMAATLCPDLEAVVANHVVGTRFGIGVDRSDGLLSQGQEGWALTWMDARVDGQPVTPRAGKAVEVNALWISGLAAVAGVQEAVGRDSSATRTLEAKARRSFVRRFARPGGGLLDVVDGPSGDSSELRPNQLLAVSLPDAPLLDPGVVSACDPLLTSLGLRSMGPAEPGYLGRHRGGPAERDRAYHQGTVWPWLIGPYAEAARKTGLSTEGLLDGLEAHLHEWGLGSVSETADGDPPQGATGCPFQAWSVAELLRARRLLRV